MGLALAQGASQGGAGKVLTLAQDPPLATYAVKGPPLYQEDFNRPKTWNMVFGVPVKGAPPRWVLLPLSGAVESTALATPPWAPPSDSAAQALKLTAVSLPQGSELHYSLPLDLPKYKRYQISMRMGTCTGCSVKVKVGMMVYGPAYPYYISARTVDISSTAANPSRTVVLHGVFRAIGGEGSLSLRVVPKTAGKELWLDDVKVEEVEAGDINMAEDLGFGKASPAAPLYASPRLFGLHINRLGVHNGWPDMGQSILRLWDTGTAWSNLQPIEDKWVFRTKDDRLSYYVHHVNRHDSQADILYTMGQTPEWASSLKQAPCGPQGVPVYSKGACGAPADIRDWQAYVRRVASRYEGRIKYFELWNEADYYALYSSSPAQMVQMACVAKEALRDLDPQDRYGYRLVGPSITAGGVGWLDDFFAAGGGQCIDIVSYHDYYSPYDAEEFLPASVANVKFLMASYGLGHMELWNTEGGPGCPASQVDCHKPGGPPKGMLLGMQVRALATMWANGVSNFNYYFMEGASGSWTALSEAPEHATMTTAGRGFALAAKWLKGASLSRAYKLKGAPVYVFQFQSVQGKPQQLVWSVGPQALQVAQAPTWQSRQVHRVQGTVDKLAAPSTPFVLNPYEPVLLTP